MLVLKLIHVNDSPHPHTPHSTPYPSSPVTIQTLAVTTCLLVLRCALVTALRYIRARLPGYAREGTRGDVLGLVYNAKIWATFTELQGGRDTDLTRDNIFLTVSTK